MDRSLTRQYQKFNRQATLILMRLIAVLAVCSAAAISACRAELRRSGIPGPAQAVLETAIDDIDAGHYEKLYQEASDEWRRDATLEESKQTFRTLQDKLGRVRTRTFDTAREEQTGTAPIAGHSLVVSYQTSFEHAEGMETFTLIERNGRWQLARYYVTSTALK